MIARAMIARVFGAVAGRMGAGGRSALRAPVLSS